jgi:ribulose-5-phosphate 4-epimerase/fuculose-1-phosphate aldolase
MRAPPLPSAFPEERAKTATLTRMLGMQGVIGMFGHVSIRVPGTDTVLLSPGAGSDKTQVTADDVFVFNLDGTIREHPGLTVPIEWRLHTQIHRDRPDILCVAHLHAPHATLLGIANRVLEPVFIHGAFIRRGISTWDNPQLVTTDAMAADLSATLGDKIAVQMRGHGTVVCGETPELAFFFATFLEENARHQTQAAPLFGAVPLSPEHALACDEATTGNPRLIELVWNYHAAKAALT